jgi:predicted RNA-binding Zn-ribbon protein involved in translation (DUF1610 family)
MDKEYILLDDTDLEEVHDELSFEKRTCPMCGMETIGGMRGSPDSICKNCGYKDPCCYD